MSSRDPMPGVFVFLCFCVFVPAVAHLAVLFVDSFVLVCDVFYRLRVFESFT